MIEKKEIDQDEKNNIYMIIKDHHDEHVIISEAMFKNNDFEKIDHVYLEGRQIIVLPEDLRVDIELEHMPILNDAIKKKALFFSILSVIGEVLITFEIEMKK